jgi:hypothetical protein
LSGLAGDVVVMGRPSAKRAKCAEDIKESVAHAVVQVCLVSSRGSAVEKVVAVYIWCRSARTLKGHSGWVYYWEAKFAFHCNCISCWGDAVVLLLSPGEAMKRKARVFGEDLG